MRQSVTLPLTIGMPLQITTTSLPMAMQGQPYSFQLAATGGMPPYQWSGSGLPSGLTINSSGLISGTPSASGAFSVSVICIDAGG